MALTKTDVIKLYVAMFNRAPEKKGVDDWYSAATANNWDFGTLADSMIAAAQQVVAQDQAYAQIYPQYVNVDTTNADSVRPIIEEVYKILFNKTYQDDPQGIDGWVDAVVDPNNPNHVSLGHAIASITIAAEQIANDPNADANVKKAAQAYLNKVDVAEYAYNNIPDADVSGDGKIDFTILQDIIKNVTDDPATIAAAKNEVDQYTPVNVQLTTREETIVGSKAADTFTAPSLTLNDGDSIDGKDGIDTLNATIIGNVSDGVTVSNVEKININSIGDRTVDMKNFTGVESVTSDDSTGNLILNNVGNVIALGIKGTSGQLQANFTASALQGNADTLKVTLDGASAGNVQVSAGFEALEVNVASDSKLSGLTVPGVNTVAIKGKGTITVADNVLSNFTTQLFENEGKVTLGNDTVTVLSAQNNTAGVVADQTKKDAQGNVLADKTVTLNNGGAVLLGSGDDMLDITTNGTNTIRTGDGKDTISITQNAVADTINLDTGAGDDLVQINAGSQVLAAADVIDLGAGNDTARLASDRNHAMSFKNTESVHIYHNTDGNNIDFQNSDNAIQDIVVETAGAAGDNLTLSNLGDAANVKVINYDSANPIDMGSLTVGWANSVNAKTITFDTKVNTGDAEKLTVSKVQDLSVKLNDEVGSDGNSMAIDAEDSTSLTINAAKSTYLGNITSANDKTQTLKITGQDALTVGNITSTAMKTVEITAEKDLSVGTNSDSDNLESVKYVSNTGAIDYKDIGKNTTTNLSSVDISAAKAIGANTPGDITAAKIGTVKVASSGDAVTLGTITSQDAIDSIDVSGAKNVTVGAVDNDTIDGTKITSLKVTSSGGSVTLGKIAGNSTAAIGTITVSAKTDVTLADVIGDGNDTLEKLTVTATEGAITVTNNNTGAPEINMKDADGFDVSLSANTTIQDDAENAFEIQNTDGNIGTITLAGNASAKVNVTVVDSGATGGYYVNTVDASGLKGGLTTTITNADDLDSVTSSTTVSLGAKDDTIQNSVEIAGKVDSLTVNGSGGQDTITLNAATIQSGTIALGAGTDKLDLTSLNGFKVTTYGAVINLSSSSHTVDGTSVSAGKIVEFDGNDDGTNNANGGYSFTVSGVESIVGTDSNDVIYAANIGTTIDGDAGDDTIIAGAGVDTITGGAGNDVFKYVAQADSTLSNEDHITDFVTNIDIIDFSAIGVDGNTTKDFPGAITIATTALNGTANEFGGNAIAIYDDGANTTVYLDVNGDGIFVATDDLVLQLDGVTDTNNNLPVTADFLI